MSLRFEPMTIESPLSGQVVFLSASIPDRDRWTGEFDPREITDAVVAAGRAVLTAGGVLVTAAHPSIAPLLLYVAGEFPRDTERGATVITYQSALFENVMPEATVRFTESGVGDFRITPAASGDEPTPARWGESLRIMREQMFSETRPVAAVFVGGMDGVREEYDMLRARDPQPAVYPLGRPGGEAARLDPGEDSAIRPLLASGDVYPTVFREVVDDLARRLT